MRIIRYLVWGLILLAYGCKEKRSMSAVEIYPFGVTRGGDSVTLYRLINSQGAFMDVINYGCRVVRLYVPDRTGKMDDVVLGYEDIKGYEEGEERFFGALLGRYANRIEHGRFVLDSVVYQLVCNEAPGGVLGHLHGGEKGFDRVMWHAEPFGGGDTVGVCFFRLSPDGEEGYPGNLDCRVTYYWTSKNTWRIEYVATTDRPTIVNMSQHSYFNLKGSSGGTVLDNWLTIAADSMTPNKETYVPRGEIVSVQGTPFDFRSSHTFLERIDQPNDHMKIMGGYSANWVLNNQTGELAYAASLYETHSGREIAVWTTEPGLLIYTGKGLSDRIIGKGGRPLQPYDGLILETIHYPDTPNNPHFPSCVLRPGEKYYSITEYRFSTRE